MQYSNPRLNHSKLQGSGEGREACLMRILYIFFAPLEMKITDERDFTSSGTAVPIFRRKSCDPRTFKLHNEQQPEFLRMPLSFGPLSTI